MKGIISWAQGVALSLGGPGLFLIAFLDASFLSLPEINDILVVWMVTRHKERLLYYVSMATLGSIAGCFVLYWLAWKGGEAVLQKWFKRRAVERATGQIRRYGVLALLVPVHPAAAGAVQGVRPAGRGRANPAAAASRSPSASAAGSATSSRGCWPSGTATPRCGTSTSTAGKSRSWASLAASWRSGWPYVWWHRRQAGRPA